MANEYKNLHPKARMILRTADTLRSILGALVLDHVITEMAELIYKDAIKPDFKRSPDLVNYHDVVKIIQELKFPEDDVKGPEMADHNFLLGKVHSKLKELKALSKKAD